MKNNRILTAILATLLLASSLASCSRRDQFRPPETDAPTREQTTVAGQTDVSNPGESNPADTNQSGGDVTDSDTTAPPDHPIVTPPLVGGITEKTTGNPYEGWTKEQLYASFQQESERSVYNNEYGFFGNTPYYVILDVQHGGYMFSKLTGEVVSLCKDPLCEHNTCIFSHNTLYHRVCQVVDDRIYLVVLDAIGMRYVLYSFDLLMNDPKLICEWKDAPDNATVYEGKVYYNTRLKTDDGKTVYSGMVYDIREKTTTPLWEDRRDCNAIRYDGDSIWYTPRNDGSLRRFDRVTGEDSVILSGSLLNREEGETAFAFLATSEGIIYVRKRLADGNTTNILQYDTKTGELTDTGWGQAVLYGDRVYLNISHAVEENRDDPHYEYYFNSNTYGIGTRWGGKWYMHDPETGEPRVIVNLQTDGIPDCFVNSLFLDGRYILIEYQTYKDFTNPYSPTVPEWVRSRRYVVVDLTTEQAFDTGVDLSRQTAENPYG